MRTHDTVISTKCPVLIVDLDFFPDSNYDDTAKTNAESGGVTEGKMFDCRAMMDDVKPQSVVSEWTSLRCAIFISFLSNDFTGKLHQLFA